VPDVRYTHPFSFAVPDTAGTIVRDIRLPRVLLGAIVPLGVDWAGPLLYLWDNGPLSRLLTGLLFGGVAASYVTIRLLRRKARASGTGGPE